MILAFNVPLEGMGTRTESTLMRKGDTEQRWNKMDPPHLPAQNALFLTAGTTKQTFLPVASQPTTLHPTCTKTERGTPTGREAVAMQDAFVSLFFGVNLFVGHELFRTNTAEVIVGEKEDKK